MQKTKGKQGTKGAKQIHEENQATLKAYLIALSVSHSIFYACLYLFFWHSATYTILFVSGMTVSFGFLAYKFMSYMAQSTFSGKQLVDCGLDVNMEEGMGEYMKDIIIFSCIVQGLALISYKAWFLWLLVPAVGFYKLWTNILGPWFFAPAPEEPVDDKKQKKMERKAKRVQYVRG